MALSPHASRLPPARREPVTVAGSETVASAPLPTATGVFARIKAFLNDRSDSRLAQLLAGKVFLTRVGAAVLAFGSQVLMARWMGQFEFGIYVYVWTWVLMVGSVTDMGLSSAARRFIPEYTELKDYNFLRGFLVGARWLAFGTATIIAVLGAIGVTLLRPWLDTFTIVPLYLACATLPIFGLAQSQAGIAISYNWPGMALMPLYIWRQLALTLAIGLAYALGAPTDAVTVMIIAVATTWAITVGQLVAMNRKLKTQVPLGPKNYAVKTWIGTSLPIFMVEGFYLLLTYVDILALERFRPPDEVAVYYAAARILAIVAFVYFAIAGATTHKFTQYHIAGDHERLASFFAETARWTFWPSLAACALILICGKPLLALFGAGFASGYMVMFILAVGLLARAAVGPAERLLNMLGDQRHCAIIYAIAFAINLGGCVLLIPRFGIEGAAIATSSAIVVESIMFFAVTRRRLRHHVFILRHAEH